MRVETRQRNLPADQRRAVTVEAVVALTAEQNPGDITTAAIAKHMDLTQGALFRHFASKEDIWQAVMAWVAEHLLSCVDAAIEKTTSPLAALEAVFMAHIDFVAAHPGVPRLMFGELQRAEDTPAKQMVRAMVAGYRKRLSALVEAGKAAGDIEAKVETPAAVVAFMGNIQGLVMQSLMSGKAGHMRHDAPGVFSVYRRGIARVK